MHTRALALALALLLLLTQQLGVQHRAWHGSGAAAAPVAALSLLADANPADAGGTATDNAPADAQCQVCLLLAALAAAALPALLCWRGLALSAAAPLAGRAAHSGLAAAAPYQARAPPR